jgi:hypothetical protein
MVTGYLKDDLGNSGVYALPWGRCVFGDAFLVTAAKTRLEGKLFRSEKLAIDTLVSYGV